MKIRRRCLFLLLAVFIVLISGVVEACAFDTGFETVELPEKEKSEFISNINLELLKSEPAKNPIKCFDVNSNHLIAIGQNTSNRRTVCVYTEEGVFQYGYSFDCDGDFGLEWDENNLNIYFVRSRLIISVTASGSVSDVLEVPKTSKNNSYINRYIHSYKKQIEDTEYCIENDFGLLNCFATAFSRITVKNSMGEKRVIYDVSSMQLLNMITILAFVIVFVGIFVALIVRQIRKARSIAKD